MNFPPVPEGIARRVYNALQEREVREKLFEKIQFENEHIAGYLSAPFLDGLLLPEQPTSIPPLLVYGSVGEVSKGVPPVGKLTGGRVMEEAERMTGPERLALLKSIGRSIHDDNGELEFFLNIEFNKSRGDRSVFVYQVSSTYMLYSILDRAYAKFN